MQTRKVFALALALMLTAGLLAGCTVNSDGEPSPLDVGNQDLVNNRGEENQQGGDVEKPVFQGINSAARYRSDLGLVPGQFEGKTLTIWTFFVLDEEGEAELWADIRAFEELTGVKINYVNDKIWETYSSELIKGISTGDGPDICVFDEEVVPAWVMKGYLVPLSDYIDFSQVTLPLSDGVKQFYTFNGKLYTFPELNVDTGKLYFRGDIFANASLPNPYDLWKEGKWTWDNFVDLAQRVRQDTDGDGEYDIWGYYSWRDAQYLYSNGANYVQWVDGKPVEGLSDSKAIRAFEWHRALSEQYDIVAPYDPDKDPMAMLVSGDIAMTYHDHYVLTGADGLRSQLGDKLGVAPFPRGPDLPADIPFGDHASGHKEGISGAAKEPEIAAIYMLFKRLPIDEADEAAKKAKEEADNVKWFGSLEAYEMNLAMSNYAVVTPLRGFTGLDSVVARITASADSNMTIAQAIEAYKGVAQNYIDMTWDSQ
ncbi:MAG: extracellular solute-binding protein [Oscillospiraceae bacterium]|jgi:ABC-type glycerol-3-phosphate transport system substrate-binding protein|nr:extracellular solute-binding protein [Oscillospiraceae bacterium]